MNQILYSDFIRDILDEVHRFIGQPETKNNIYQVEEFLQQKLAEQYAMGNIIVRDGSPTAYLSGMSVAAEGGSVAITPIYANDYQIIL